MPDDPITPAEDLNSIVCSAILTKPIDYADPVSFLEVKIRHGLAVTFISVHAPLAMLRQLYALNVGDRVLVRGQLAYAKADRAEGRVRLTLDDGRQVEHVLFWLTKVMATGVVDEDAEAEELEAHKLA